MFLRRTVKKKNATNRGHCQRFCQRTKIAFYVRVFSEAVKIAERLIERYREVWRGMEARSRKAALESAPVRHGNRTKRSLAHVCMILDEAGRNERVRVRRSRRENRNSRWSSHAAAKKTRPLLSVAGEYIKGHVVRAPLSWFPHEVE